MMKFFRVKKEYLDLWTDECEAIVSESELKRLSEEFSESVRSLKAQSEPVKYASVKIDRFFIGDYVIEIEEKDDPDRGHMFDGWIYKSGIGYKEHMFGWPVNQTEANEPHIYTKDEVLELFLVNAPDYIKGYDETMEIIEDAMARAMDDCFSIC